jgi:hypothetical protein
MESKLMPTLLLFKGACIHLTAIAAFVHHGSTNPQKYYAQDTKECQANIAFGIQYDHGNHRKKSSPPPQQPARIFQDNQQLQHSSGWYESPSDDTGLVSMYSASPGYMHGHYYHPPPYGYHYQQPFPPPQYNPYGYGYPAGYGHQAMPPPPPPPYAAYGPVYPSHGIPPMLPNPYAGQYPPQGMPATTTTSTSKSSSWSPLICHHQEGRSLEAEAKVNCENHENNAEVDHQNCLMG